MINLGKYPVLGTSISAVDYESAVQTIIYNAKQNSSLTATAIAVHGLVEGICNPLYRYKLNTIDLVLPDGQPVRWALRFIHNIRLPDRVYGPKLFLKIIENAVKENIHVFFYGSTKKILQLLLQELKYKFPRLIIAGAEPSKFRKISQKEKIELTEKIQTSKARIVFVGLGCPRQESWIYECRKYIKVPLIAVGAAFPIHAGIQRQAPKWMQNCGIEWFYRLTKEPKRLWKRYIILNPIYIFLILLEILGLKKYVVCKPNVTKEEELYG